RQETFFTGVSQQDLKREEKVKRFVTKHLRQWQEDGLVPDMAIESGYNTDQPIWERGWTYWHHLFNSRQLLLHALYFKYHTPECYIFNARTLDLSSRISRWLNDSGRTKGVFYNQALNTLYNYGTRAFSIHETGRLPEFTNNPLPPIKYKINNHEVHKIKTQNDIYVTDPPYADAVHYHEITEYFIAWLRKNPPKPFNQWVWDSRRALAIKGSGNAFRKGMVDAYKAMADHMPDNGRQC
ncbi:MAG: hypothetical protein OXC48_09040, partial [Endozoicomonadaceae bacterium]|nr:hypothetical protein [Endozoicomonadaceae bacterium]